MRITYRREIKHNYMIVDPELMTWRNYECHMLSENPIDGILRFQIRQVDDEIRFYYEITSRQPLSRMLDNLKIREPDIKALILGIAAVLDKMEQYLLREGSVLLEPDYIYVEPDTFRIWLCLVPGLERDFPEDYGKLLEYLLGKVDHQDKESVVLAYRLYQETRKENYGMEDILRLLSPGGKDSEAKDGRTASEKGKTAATGDWGEPGGSFDDGFGGRTFYSGTAAGTVAGTAAGTVAGNAAGTVAGTAAGRAKKGRTKPGLLGRIRGWWKQKHISAGKDRDPVQVPWEMLFREDGEGLQDGRGSQGSLACPPGQAVLAGTPKATGLAAKDGLGAASPMGLTAPGDHVKGHEGHDTVLLADLSGEGRDKPKRLCSLEGEEDIVLSYYPFIIGKQENLVDYLLDRETVSRLHLRIDRDGDRYFAQDLNSTNGTVVGGRTLEANESVELHPGDEVEVAVCRYRFL